MFDPARGEAWAEVAAGDARDVDDAVNAAQAAFPAWAALRNSERSRHLEKLADALEARIEAFQRLQRENPDLDLTLDAEELAVPDLDDEELQAALQVGKRLTFKMAHLDLQRWLDDLRADKQQMNWLYLAALDIVRDAATVARLVQAVRTVHASPAVLQYVVDLAAASRSFRTALPESSSPLSVAFSKLAITLQVARSAAEAAPVPAPKASTRVTYMGIKRLL